jgi:hypothetical protein
VTLHIRALRDRILRGGGGLTGRRNWLILADTCVTALTGLALLIGAARALAPAALSSFALAQLIVVTSVGILRPAFYSAALAAQRTPDRRASHCAGP